MNLYLLEYALTSLLIKKRKSLFLFILLSVVTALFAATFMLLDTLQYRQAKALDAMPDIVVQKELGGRVVPIEERRLFSFLDIQGVKNATPRIWGHYYFANANLYLTIIGIDSVEYSSMQLLERHALDIDQNSMILSDTLSKLFEKHYYKDSFSFITPSGKKIELVQKVLLHEDPLFSTDLIIMSAKNAREILGLPEEYVSDIALFVANSSEVATIVKKIQKRFHDLRVTTKEQLQNESFTLFSVEGGFFFALFFIALLVFAMIVYDNFSNLSFMQAQEIAILKTIGWSVADIMRMRLYEALFLALFAFVSGLILALCYLFIFDAPLLKNLFGMYELVKGELHLTFHSSWMLFGTIFLAIIPLYVASILIPTWRVATLEVDEVLR